MADAMGHDEAMRERIKAYPGTLTYIDLIRRNKLESAMLVVLMILLGGVIGSLIGVAICVSGSSDGIHLLGDLLAVVMTLSFAAMTVISRARPSMPVLPPNILAVAATLVIVLPFARLDTIGAVDAGLLAAFGLTNFVLAGTLYLAGSARLPAARSSLIITLDIVLSPALVWAAFGEAPSLQVLIGGAIVFVAVVATVVTGPDRAPPASPTDRR